MSPTITQESKRNVAIFLNLQMADVFTTLIGFRVGLSEANSALSSLFPILGAFGGLLAGKLIMSALICWFVPTHFRGKWGLVNGFFALLVLWNTVLIAMRFTGRI